MLNPDAASKQDFKSTLSKKSFPSHGIVQLRCLGWEWLLEVHIEDLPSIGHLECPLLSMLGAWLESCLCPGPGPLCYRITRDGRAQSGQCGCSTNLRIKASPRPQLPYQWNKTQVAPHPLARLWMGTVIYAHIWHIYIETHNGSFYCSCLSEIPPQKSLQQCQPHLW